MPKLPRLNQTATLYSTLRQTDYGKLVVDSVPVTVDCRYTLTDGTFRDQRGMDVENLVDLHMDYNETVKQGSLFVLSDGLTYIVENRTHTTDLNGGFFMTYCQLKEHYIEVI